MAQGNINIGLFVHSAAFEKGLSKASKSAKGFTAQIAGLHKSLTGLGTTLLAGFGVQQIHSQMRAAADALDQIGDAAERTGIEVGKFSELQIAANLGDVDMNDFINAIQRMNKTLGDAALKGTETGRTLEGLGLNLDTLRKMSPDLAFVAIAEAIGKVESPALRASLATDIFSKMGIKLTAMLGRLPELMERVRSKNLAIGASAIKAAGEMDQATKEMQASWTKLLAEMIPIETELTRIFSGIISGGNRITDAFRRVGEADVLGFQAWLKGPPAPPAPPKPEEIAPLTTLATGQLAVKGLTMAYEQLTKIGGAHRAEVEAGVVALERQARTMRMSAEQLAFLELREKGLTAAQRERALAAAASISRGGDVSAIKKVATQAGKIGLEFLKATTFGQIATALPGAIQKKMAEPPAETPAAKKPLRVDTTNPALIKGTAEAYSAAMTQNSTEQDIQKNTRETAKFTKKAADRLDRLTKDPVRLHFVSFDPGE